MGLGMTPQQLLLAGQSVQNGMEEDGLGASEEERRRNPLADAAYQKRVAAVSRKQGVEKKRADQTANFYRGMELAGQAAKTFGPALTKGVATLQARGGEFDQRRMGAIGSEARQDILQDPRVDVNTVGADFLSQPSSVDMTRNPELYAQQTGGDYSPTQVELTPGETQGIRAAFARIFGA